MFAKAQALLEINSFLSVYQARKCLSMMLRLSHKDPLGVHRILPYVMLRVCDEQVCYNFLKWWANRDSRPIKVGLDNNDASLNSDFQYLDLPNDDVFEPLLQFPNPSANLSLDGLVALTLLKLRLLLDLQTYELHLHDRSQAYKRHIGDFALSRVRSWDSKRLSKVISSLTEEYRELYMEVHKKNSHFWGLLSSRKWDFEHGLLASYPAGSLEEAEAALIRCRQALEETEDALDIFAADVHRLDP